VQARRWPELDPGAATGEVTVEATVEQWADPKDDYRVQLAVGDTLEIEVRSQADQDLDLVVWRSDAPAFAPGSDYARRWLAAAALGPGTASLSGGPPRRRCSRRFPETRARRCKSCCGLVNESRTPANGHYLAGHVAPMEHEEPIPRTRQPIPGTTRGRSLRRR
jgi:hypothetical protein